LNACAGAEGYQPPDLRTIPQTVETLRDREKTVGGIWSRKSAD
jgi:hypothetical protein